MSTKITDLSTKSTPAAADLVIINDVSASADKKATVGSLATAVAANVPSGGQQTTTLSNPYKFGVYLTSSQTPVTNLLTKVVLNVKEFDTGSNFDNVTNFRFTAPVAGFYHFDGKIDSGSTRIVVSLYKNGSEIKRGTDGTAAGGVVSSLIQLAANDFVELWGLLSTGSFGNSGSFDTYLNGFLVSVT